MKYTFTVALAALLGLASASPMAAQDRGRSNDDDARVIIRDRDDDGSRRGSRQETGRSRGDSRDDRVENRRGETREVERGRTSDSDRRRSGEVDRNRQSRRVGDIFETRRRRDDRRRDDDWDDDDWDDDDWDDDDYRDRNRRNGKGGGPAFCRSGAGHPVFGRAWCRDKGFGVGGRDYDDWERRRRNNGDWERHRTRDIYFPSRRNRNDRYLDGYVLERIIGDALYGRLGSHARGLRATGPIRGRWNGNSELRIYAGNYPFARLVDTNRDNRADIIYLRR